MEKIFTLGNCLNLGCGFNYREGFINVDAYDICKPDVVWNLDDFPWPFEDGTIDYIYAHHVFEHLDDWWRALAECARVLRYGGMMEMFVPDESSSTAGTYRDHKTIFNWVSFYGIESIAESQVWLGRGNNAWAAHQTPLPIVITRYNKVPRDKYNWMVRWCPKILQFCAEHFRNFIWEQQFEFRKVTKKEIEDRG